ncbi:MAG: glycosyltransferase [Phycisphaeraceae bacterium]|nr:glycosyltransferase [Phycisphaeraceae bacterium]MCW5754652.1 glycosyltransferase [Phycisphaeraceae bacterium]
MPLRILHISTRLILGGSQENTVLSCEGQARLGHQLHLAFGPIFGPEGSLLDRVTSFRTASGNAIAAHEIPDLVRELAPLRDRRALRQLIRLLHDIKPDVIHTHSSKAGILGRLAGWRYNRALGGDRAAHAAIVHTIHGPPFMPLDGPLINRIRRRLTNALYTLAERHAARRCHLIVAVADAMTREFLRRNIGSSTQYITVRSGMETDSFLHPQPGEDRASIRRQLGLLDDDFVIGTVARLAEHKGHDDLLDALADDLRANPAWKLLWVGDGWWKDRLLQRVRSLGLQNQVLTTGLVPPERVPGLMRAMDLLAHPSTREGLPRTLPQAFLCGVPAVAYDVDGTGEICIDGQTGCLIRPGDIPSLRQAVRRLAADPELRNSMAARGKTIAERDFSTSGMVAQLEQVYAQALAIARAT